MSRKSKIVYNPKLSVEENAAKNNVSVAGIYYYLRSNNINRTQANAKKVVSEIKKAIEDNPDASQAKIAKITGKSVTTVNKYWKSATKGAPVRTDKITKDPKPYEWDNSIPAIEGGEYDLFSENVSHIPYLLKAADEWDVEGLRQFLFEHPERPLLIIGNGGANDFFAGAICEMCCGIARCITPLELAAMSDAVIMNSRCLLLSAGGGNIDMAYAIDRVGKLIPEHTAYFAFGVSERSHYHKLDGTAARGFIFRPPYVPHKKAFVQGASKFFRNGIIYRAFSGHNVGDIDIDISSSAYKYHLNRVNGRITPPSKIKHLYALYNGYSMPVAKDLLSVFAESGSVSVQLTDYRNFCHGRFLFASNHTKHTRKDHSLAESDVAMVLYVTPRDKGLVDSIRNIAIPTRTPVVIIESKYNDARATIDLLARTMVFIADFQEKGWRINPCNPENYSSEDIDKRYPESSVRFAKELKDNGPLKLFEPSIIEQEPQDTAIETTTPMKVDTQSGPQSSVSTRRRKAKNTLESSLSQMFTSVINNVIDKELKGENPIEPNDPPRNNEQSRIYGIIGAIIGDIAGSSHSSSRTTCNKVRVLFGANASITDDTVLTAAIADAIKNGKTYTDAIWEWGHNYSFAKYGGGFRRWMEGDKNTKSNSAGNGAAMRVSPVGFYAKSLDEALEFAKESAIPTHDNIDAIKGAQSIAAAIFLARENKTKKEIKKYIESEFGYDLNLSKEDIQAFVPSLSASEKALAKYCAPIAISAFLAGSDYEDVVKTAITYLGYSDTIACIAGGIAAAYYGVPMSIAEEAVKYLDDDILRIVNQFDGASLESKHITPKNPLQWKNNIVVVYGSNVNGRDNEDGGADTHESRYNQYPRDGYPIRTIGANFDTETSADITEFIQHVNDNPDKMFLIKKVGIDKAQIPIERIAPLFKPLYGQENVYFPLEYIEFYKGEE